MRMEEKTENCPDCERRGLWERLLIIPPREGRLQHLYCAQCEGEFPCDDKGNRGKSKHIICY